MRKKQQQTTTIIKGTVKPQGKTAKNPKKKNCILPEQNKGGYKTTSGSPFPNPS
jgi:hypothetical protein